jgi:hypothetical protein
MKTIQQAMLEEIYTTAIKISRKNNQTAGEKNDYYITLEQLEAILKEYEG